MTQLAEAGATILPAAPGFYHKPQTIDDLVDHVVGRIFNQLGIDANLVPQWQVGDDSALTSQPPLPKTGEGEN